LIFDIVLNRFLRLAITISMVFHVWTFQNVHILVIFTLNLRFLTMVFNVKTIDFEVLTSISHWFSLFFTWFSHWFWCFSPPYVKKWTYLFIFWQSTDFSICWHQNIFSSQMKNILIIVKNLFEIFDVWCVFQTHQTIYFFISFREMKKYINMKNILSAKKDIFHILFSNICDVWKKRTRLCLKIWTCWNSKLNMFENCFQSVNQFQTLFEKFKLLKQKFAQNFDHLKMIETGFLKSSSQKQVFENFLWKSLFILFQNEHCFPFIFETCFKSSTASSKVHLKAINFSIENWKIPMKISIFIGLEVNHEICDEKSSNRNSVLRYSGGQRCHFLTPLTFKKSFPYGLFEL
jgi:hypothetical protein